MVLVKLRIRPKCGYNAPGNIQTIDIESSQRLETLLQRSQGGPTGTRATSAASSHAALYYNGLELPLNSSVASQNFRDGTILESCASPLLSSALSAVLRDLNSINQKIPSVTDRGYATLSPLLEVPLELHSHDNSEFWKRDRWTYPQIQKRIVCLATMKKVLQRDDRYSVYNLPACSDLETLHAEMRPVWMEQGKTQSQRKKNNPGNQGKDNLSFGSSGYLFTPSTKKGTPSTIWTLLQQKLLRQIEISADFNDLGMGGDAIEAFVEQDYLRHHKQLPSKPGRKRRNTNNVGGTKATTSNSTTSSSTTRYEGNSIGTRDNTVVDSGSVPSTPIRQNKVYCPEFASGPFAILSALVEAMLDPDSNKRQLSLNEKNLKRRAQPKCKSNFYDRAQGRGARNAFACMEGLAEKGLVRRERIGEPIVEKWGLLLEGEKMANFCLQFERAVKDSIMKSDQFRGNGNRVSIVMDNREDMQFRERLKWHCEDQNIVFQEKELPAGDYLFLTQAEEVFPIIIERKTWSDLADSVMGKGRGRRRLDCVKIGSTSGECERRKCQLCKMKKSGLNQRIFFIEGSRCHGRDGIRSKCNLQKRCQPCKQLIERHGSEVIQETLEQVLNKLQIEHGCHIHFTRSYNETIESLIMIRNLIEDGETFATLRAAGNTTVPLQRKDNQSTVSYQQFCSNIRDPQAPFPFANRKRGDVNDWTALHLANILSQEPTDWGKELCMELYGVTPRESNKSEPCLKPSDRPTNLLQSCDNLKSTDEVIDLSESQNSMDLNDSLDSVVILDESQDSVVILDVMNDSMSSDQSIVVLDDVVNVMHQDSTSTFNESRQSSALTSIKKSYLCGLNIPNDVLHSCPLLIIHRWEEHDKDFYDKFNAVWQSLYRKMLNRVAPVADDLYNEAVRQLSQLVCKDDFPFIPRQIMSFVILWLQIKFGIQVRIVTKNSQADHIRNLWSQKRHHPDISVKSGIRQTERGKRKLDLSNPSPIDKSKGTSFNSPRCNKSFIDERPNKSRRTMNSETSAAIEARLRRFQNEDASSKIPPSKARIQNDFIDSQQSSGWTCSKCTLENGDYDEVCLMCKQSRNSNQSIPPSHHTLKTSNETEKSSWSCPQCTFENVIGSAQCLLCNATKTIQPVTPISYSKSHTYAPSDSPRSSYDVRMVSKTSQKQKGSIWVCSSCTLENSVKDSRCSACHKLKYETQATPPSKSQMSSSFENSSIKKSYTTQNSYRQVTSSVSTISSKASGVKCGACGAFGHNRGSANEHNCAAFFEQAEVDLRTKKRTKAREKAEKERDELERMKAEELMTREKGEKSLKEMQQIVADHEQSLKGHSRLQKEDIKRREKRLKNAQRRAGRL